MIVYGGEHHFCCESFRETARIRCAQQAAAWKESVVGFLLALLRDVNRRLRGLPQYLERLQVFNLFKRMSLILNIALRTFG